MQSTYTAHFSARKKGAIGQFYSVRLKFEGESGLDRETGFKLAWDALEASGHECHHLVSLDADPTHEFAHRIKALGFRVFIAERGHYGFITDDTEKRVLTFSFSDGSSLGGAYGPPSTTSGTGWRLEQTPYGLKTAEDVRAALDSYPPACCGNGWKYLVSVKQYLALYGDSSRFQEV